MLWGVQFLADTSLSYPLLWISSGQIPSVHMIDPMHFDRVSHDDVIKKWGVSSDKLGDVLALAGDSSDNIPGAPGIGPKIAASLIEEYGSLERLIDQSGSIKQKKRRESLVENAEKVREEMHVGFHLPGF